VKITPDVPALPFLPKSEDSISVLPSLEKCLSKDVVPHVAPDKCNSSIYNSINDTKKRTMAVPTRTNLDPIDSSLFLVNESKLPALLTDEENEDEFGEFLLDAVQWL